MASESFTRDEVILALDVFSFSEAKRITPESTEMQELSYLLNHLPIHPMEQIKKGFRNLAGILQQLNLFKRSMKNSVKNSQVGKLFFEVAFDFEDNMDLLHKVAQSIRRNQNLFSNPYGGRGEESFPEGTLLAHLHQNIEKKASHNIPHTDSCEICCFKPNLQYKPCGDLLQIHLIVPPEQLVGKKIYFADDFLTVCPTCHAALHRYRPWLTKENCGDVLR